MPQVPFKPGPVTGRIASASCIHTADGHALIADLLAQQGSGEEDYRLHAEPGDVFFGISRAEPGLIEFTPLAGRIRLSGDCSFGV